MKRVHIIHDPYKLNESTVADVENPLEYLKSEFKDGFPEHAKIYKGSIAVENDITEKLQKDELLINLIDDDIWVVIWPAWVQILYYAVVALTAALSIYTYLTMPKPQQGIDQGSSNNELGQRQNKTRIGGRIPDIFGTVRAYPDLIAPAYRYYENNVEIEEVLAVLGVGHYDVERFKEGDTAINQISGVSVSTYDPGMSITTSSPAYRYGEILNTPPLIASRSASIVDKSLPQPNYGRVANDTMTFSYPNTINVNSSGFSAGEKIILDGAVFGIGDSSLSGSTNIDFAAKILTVATTANIANPQNYKLIEIASLTAIDPVNGSLSLSGNYPVANIIKTGAYVYEIYLSSPESINQNWLLLTEDNTALISSTLTRNIDNIDLDGEYTISTVDTGKIVLSAPDTTNPDWLKINGTIGGEFVVLYGSTNNWQGWYESYGDHEGIIVNFYAPQGLYYIGQKGWKDAINVTVAVEYQQINNQGVPIGVSTTINDTLYGWSGGSMTDPIGLSIKANFNFKGNVRYRVRKVTTILNNGNTNVHDVLCRSVFITSKSDKLTYNDVTVVRAKTVNNDVSSAINQRMLNCIATRKLPLNGTGALTATRSAAQALIYLALDDKNGRRSINEVDIAQILAEEQAVINYFGSTKAAEFSYTFDDNNLSFEEIAGMVSSTMFCEAYRYGNKLRIRFEKPQPNSVLLFNAANKAPNTEKRTKNFGVQNKYDGVEIEYTSPDDDTRITYVASDDENPINTMQIKTSGIRSHEQAKARAWREWNKLKYRNITCEFEALEESELLARNDRILVADNTVVKTKDGIIDFIDGLTLGLSHPIESNVPYFIYLQLADGRVDIVPCSYVDEYTVLLNRPPLIALVPEFTTYQLIESTETPSNAFMVTEIRPQGKMTNMLTCVNYDERYYQNDADFF